LDAMLQEHGTAKNAEIARRSQVAGVPTQSRRSNCIQRPEGPGVQEEEDETADWAAASFFLLGVLSDLGGSVFWPRTEETAISWRL